MEDKNNIGLRAINNVQKGNYREALKQFNTFIENLEHANKELDADDAIMYYNRAIAKTQLSDLDGAVQDLNTAISINPSFYHAFAERGKIYMAKEKYSKAINDYTKSLEINPSNASHYLCQRGYANINAGNKQQAIHDFVNAYKNGSKEAEKVLKENTNYFSR